MLGIMFQSWLQSTTMNLEQVIISKSWVNSENIKWQTLISKLVFQPFKESLISSMPMEANHLFQSSNYIQLHYLPIYDLQSTHNLPLYDFPSVCPSVSYNELCQYVPLFPLHSFPSVRYNLVCQKVIFMAKIGPLFQFFYIVN